MNHIRRLALHVLAIDADVAEGRVVAVVEGTMIAATQ